jgi:hypothetical protein
MKAKTERLPAITYRRRNVLSGHQVFCRSQHSAEHRQSRHLLCSYVESPFQLLRAERSVRTRGLSSRLAGHFR